MKNERKYGIDIIKVLASIFVIIIHHFISVGYYGLQMGSGKEMYLATVIQAFGLTAVPLFLICTGYLLSKKKISKDYFSSLIYFLIEVLVIYCFVSFFQMLNTDNFSMLLFIKTLIKNILSPKYYVGLYISLYLIAPFLNRLFFSLEDKEKYILDLVLIFTISLPTLLNNIPHINFFDTKPTAVWAILYYFIGLNFRHFSPKFNKKMCVFFMFFFSMFFSFLVNHILAGKTYKYIFGYYEGIFTVILSVLIFMSIYNVDVKNNNLKKILKSLSSYTLIFYIFGEIVSDKIAIDILFSNGKPTSLLSSFPSKVLLSIVLTLPIAYLYGLFVNRMQLKIRSRK